MANKQSVVLTGIRLAVAGAVLWYLAASGGLQWSSLAGLHRVWPLTILALGLLATATVLSAWRLCILMSPRSFQLTLAASIQLTLIGIFFNTCLPGAGGGDLVRIYYATQGNQGRRTEVVTVMVLDRVTGMFSLVLWPLLLVPIFWGMVAGQSVLAVLLGAGVVILFGMIVVFAVAWTPRVAEAAWMQALLERLPGARYARMIFGTITSYRKHRRVVLTAVGVSLIAHTLAMTAALLLAHATNPGGFAWEMAILIPLGFMANQIPLTPGGLGIGEAAFDSLFGLAGLEGGAVVMLSWRLLLLLFGLMGLVAYVQARQRYIGSAPEDSGSRSHEAAEPTHAS